MTTIRLVPSTYTTTLSVTNPSNMYTDTDSTTYGTMSTTTRNTTTYYTYLKGFDFSQIPSEAVIDSFTIKVKAMRSGGSAVALALTNNTTTISGTPSSTIGTTATTITFSNTPTWDTIKGYDSNFGIRIPVKRSNKNQAASVNIYGAEILVEYHIPIYHNVSITQSTGGTITATPTGSVEEGTTVSVTATPNTGYRLVNILVNGSAIEGNTFVVATDSVITASFEEIPHYNVIVQQSTGGTITATPTGSVEEGTVVTVSVNITDGYELENIYVNGEVLSDTTFTVTRDSIVTASFTEIIYYNVSATQSTGGTITLTPSGRVIEGTVITVSISVADGYELENVYINGVVLTGNTFTPIEDTVVTATYIQLINYTVLTSITNGTLRTPTTASMSIVDGNSCEITFNGNSECTFSSMTVNGTEVTPITKNAPAPLPTYTVSTNYGTYSTYALSNAYDGNDSTYFWSNESQASGKYILITFSDYVNLTSFSTYSSNSTDYPHSCNVLQVSADRSTWTDIGTFSDIQTTSFSSITNAQGIKYARIYASSSISNWLVLNEITMSYEAAALGEEYYSYTISSVNADTEVIITFAEPDTYYVKVDGEWKKTLVVYKKVDGAWTEFEYSYNENEKLVYLGHIVSDVIGEVTSNYDVNITDTSIPNDTYYFYYEDENKQKLTDWDAIGSTEFTGYNGGTSTTGEEVGAIADDNSISLTDTSLASGDYTLYYEDASGTKLEGWDSIGTITK